MKTSKILYGCIIALSIALIATVIFAVQNRAKLNEHDDTPLKMHTTSKRMPADCFKHKGRRICTGETKQKQIREKSVLVLSDSLQRSRNNIQVCYTQLQKLHIDKYVYRDALPAQKRKWNQEVNELISEKIRQYTVNEPKHDKVAALKYRIEAHEQILAECNLELEDATFKVLSK